MGNKAGHKGGIGKHKAYQSYKNKAYYAHQFLVTERNKERRRSKAERRKGR